MRHKMRRNLDDIKCAGVIGDGSPLIERIFFIIKMFNITIIDNETYEGFKDLSVENIQEAIDILKLFDMYDAVIICGYVRFELKNYEINNYYIKDLENPFAKFD